MADPVGRAEVRDHGHGSPPGGKGRAVSGFKIGDLVEFKSKHLELDYGEFMGTYGVLLDLIAGAGDRIQFPTWRIMWNGRVVAIADFHLRRVGSV